MLKKENIVSLYENPFPSTRTGALFNSFSYPTKISPEAIALFIACHTKVGDTVFDPFGGSGTTGIAAMLCDKPTDRMKELAEKYKVSPNWGKRDAIIYELSPIASAIGDVLCHTNPQDFYKSATKLISTTEKEESNIYQVKDSNGEIGKLRYVIWTDIIICPNCGKELRYSDVAILHDPIRFVSDCKCPHCGKAFHLDDATKQHSETFDPCLNSNVITKNRRMYKIYGTTGKKNWSRLATNEDDELYHVLTNELDYSFVPIHEMKWGDLYRSGYHLGISYVHQMYTSRNAYIMSKLWHKVDNFPQHIRKALKVFLLSYNQSHSTLMTRVVAKKDNKDFVITGAQPGVLYISSLPVEKNIFEGLKRKIKTFADAFKLVEGSTSTASFRVGSSLSTDIAERSIDYVFTDPPFGDYIPYSEINQLNEAWLGIHTNPDDEVIINDSQNKPLAKYQCLMESAFKEVNRVLKKDGVCTVVFHSAKSAIWRAIIKSYQKNGLSVIKTGVLDKVQASFKQVNSNITVKGDPLILLSKHESSGKDIESIDDISIAKSILKKYSSEDESKEKSEKMFSEYIAFCIEKGVVITLDANFFFHG